MNLDKEIRRIVEYQNAMIPKQSRKSKEAVETLIEKTQKAYADRSYDFSDFTSIRLKQQDKIRKVKLYPAFSSEEILCIYLKRLLDRTFHIKYPNRNVFMRSAFDVVSSLKDMQDFTVFKFDFLDFFNSISSEFVFERYMKEKIRERYQMDLLSDFVKSTKYAYAGLNTSNIISEIIAKKFDELLLVKLDQKGVIFYRRYIDDGLLIFNRYISNDECVKIVEATIQEVFYAADHFEGKSCKTRLNVSKLKYIAKRDLSVSQKAEFDFLGYNFVMCAKQDGKTELKYGITKKKIDKYTKRIQDMVKDYAESKIDLELLRHQIKAFSHRTVYRVHRYKAMIWKNKGFISNYCELRDRMDDLTPETEFFLKNVIIKAFSNAGIPPAYFVKNNKKESIYNLYNNMKRYKTLLFVESIGIGMETLKKRCIQLKIPVDGKSYDELVREYLIKVKVGH